MSTPLVVRVTDELVAELEEACREHFMGFMIESAEVKALLAERAELLRDAKRWRKARDILTVEAIEYAQSEFINFGMPPDEAESVRADQAIDAAMQSEAKQ